MLMLVLVEVQPAEATFPGQNGRIAYSSLTETDYDIFTVKATGGGESFNVTDNTTDDFSPAYSPNGRRIAYEGDATGIDIYTISSTGGTPFQVTNNTTEDAQPSYSPNGKKSAYVHSDGTDFEIYKIDHNGGTPIQVTNNRREDFEPSWGSLP